MSALIDYLEHEKHLENRKAQLNKLIVDSLYELDECIFTTEERECKESYIEVLRTQLKATEDSLVDTRLNIRRQLQYYIFGDGITFNPNLRRD